MKDDEKAAIREAYLQEIRNEFSSLLTVIIMNGNVEEACQRFEVGLRNTRKAMELALKMISE